MYDAPIFLDFVYLPSYERSAKSVLSDEEQQALEQALLERPEAGAVVRGTGGVRKVRIALAGRGKSGGARVIYFYRSARQRIYLILAYAKNVRESITEDERRAMKKLTAALENEP